MGLVGFHGSGAGLGFVTKPAPFIKVINKTHVVQVVLDINLMHAARKGGVFDLYHIHSHTFIYFKSFILKI